MKKQFKKITAVLLTVVMVLSVFTILPTSAASISDEQTVGSDSVVSGDYQYSVKDDGTAIVDKYVGFDVDVKMPSKIDGYKITEIGDNAFYKYRYFKSIVIPDSVTAIGAYVFSECEYLENVAIPDSVKSIGDFAFAQSPSLKSIVLPNGLTSLGEMVFYNCTALESVNIPEVLTAISDGLFAGCCALTDITIPNNITSIGVMAFWSCTSLTDVSLPESLTSIEDSAFSTTGLTQITIPNGVTSIGNDAFKPMDETNPITIRGYRNSYAQEYARQNNYAFIPVDGEPLFSYDIKSDGTIEITSCNFDADDYNQYYGMNGTEYGYLEIPSSIDGYTVTIIGSNAFYGKSFVNITIPGTVKEIGSSAFSNCSINTINIPESVETIQCEAFSVCYNLAQIYIPDSVTYIGQGAFKNCINLDFIELSNNLTSIEDSLFEGCSRLGNVSIPNTVKSIGASAFKDCTFLGGIELPNNLVSIGMDAFANTLIDNLIIPDSVTNIDGNLGVNSISCNIKTYALEYAVNSGICFTILNPILGDLNLDGEVNIKDATKLQELISDPQRSGNLYTFMRNFDDVADLNSDNSTDVSDVTLIQKLLAGYALK